MEFLSKSGLSFFKSLLDLYFATKSYVNKAISTNTGKFWGTFNSLSDLQEITGSNGDYAYVIVPDDYSTSYDRYKWQDNQWVYEYTVGGEAFDDDQWAAINSGITSADKTRLNEISENIGNNSISEMRSDIDAEKVHADSLIFDVTKENAGATFASLSALLSSPNLSTLIPTSVRTGGMTIRFVLTSDNNYVQYMYRGTDITTADTFTNVINWEKVNLEQEVDGLASVKVAISSGKNLFDKTSCKIGYAITASGRIIEVSGAGITPLIKISAETQYCYSYQAGSNAFHGYYGIYYDEKLNVLSIQSAAYTFTTPENAAYFVASFGVSHINDIQLETGSARTTYESFNPIMGYLSASLSPINDAIATINTKLSTDEEQIANNTDNIGYIPFTLEQGSLNPSNGALSDDATRVRTKYIVGKFSIRTNSGYYINRICEYNKTTNAFIQTLFNNNTNRLTSYNYTGTQEIKLVFSKQNILHNILPTEDIIKDAIYDASLADRVGKLEGETILPTSYDTFNLENEKVSGFMSSQAYDDNDYSYTNVLSFVSGNVALKLDTPSPVRLTWPKSSDVLRTLVTVIENGVGTRLSSKAVTYEVTSGNNYLEIYNLVPGKTYLYGVYSYTPTGIKTILESSFTTTGQVRMIKVNRVSNVRDIGGWSAESNKKIKYCLLYRGSEFNPSSKGSINLLDAETKEMMRKVLGIKAEIDLRGGFSNLYNTRNGLSEAASLLGADIDYTKYNYVSYDSAITSGTTINSIISSLISNLQNNKATYIHCAGGCDRTGTVIALIMGACGVSESDIAKEYELTSFSPDIRTRNSETYNYAGMIDAIKTYSGSTFQEKVVSFLTTDGNISASDIATLKSLLLE